MSWIALEKLEQKPEITDGEVEAALDAVSFGTNLRAGAAYRRHLASVLANRGIRELEGEQA